MKKFFLSLAVFIMALCVNAQTNQYFWYNGNLMMGNPIAQIDSVTFGEGEPADTLHILLPRTIIKEVHDTVYITVHDTVCPTDVPEGALAGEFSVSATKKVRFSKGNLQYKASTNIWRFAEHQYDMIGSGNCSISDTYDDWIDLFGFGTGNNPTISSTSSSDYSTFVDWGKNAISNGGNTANLWRTLKGEEWGYIFHSRANAASLFGFGCVNGVDGLIILPDEWTLPDGLTFSASISHGLKEQGETFVNNNKNNYSHNSYTEEQWAIMEYYGAVFLPAAGDRNGIDLEMVGPGGYGNGGHYWSAVPYDEDYSYDLNFNNKNFKPNFYQGVRMLGESVRLVLDVE